MMPVLSGRTGKYESGWICLEAIAKRDIGGNGSLDEQMVKSNHRCRYNLKQQPKPIRNGSRLISLCAVSGILVRFILDRRNTKISDVVVDLLRCLAGSNRTIYMDNLYTSYRLFSTLKSMGILACGTCRSHQRGFPASLMTNNLTLQVGEWKWLVREGVVAVAWMDSKHVLFMTTAHKPSSGDTQVRRKVPGTQGRPLRKAPVAAEQYNLNMGGCDTGDNLRARTTIHLRASKWWKAIFCYSLDSAVNNAYLIYNKMAGPALSMSHTDFIEALVLQLINLQGPRIKVSRARPSKGRPSSSEPPLKRVRLCTDIESGIRPDPNRYVGVHLPIQGERRLNCRLCYVEQEGKELKTAILCETCHVSLCIKRGCFRRFHTPPA